MKDVQDQPQNSKLMTQFSRDPCFVSDGLLLGDGFSRKSNNQSVTQHGSPKSDVISLKSQIVS